VDCVRIPRCASLIATCAVLLGMSGQATPALAAGHSHCANSSSYREGHVGTGTGSGAHPCVHRHPTHPCPDTKLVPSPSNLAEIRTATLCLVNRERMRRGERALRANGRLERAAQGHSESMAFGDYFNHVSPSGQTPLNRMRAAGYIFSSHIGFEVGENIAWGTLWLGSPKAIVAAWMASPGHRANILDGHFRETAIGVSPHPPSSLAHGQAGGVYTQDFGVIER
jgi:uncharacterized protein YkwD